MARSSIKTYKNTVWKEFSRYIKLRDADKDGFCTCCTCNKKLRFDDINCHAGHFVSGRGNNVLFDETIVHAQCSYCNKYLSGNYHNYTVFMMEKYKLNWEDIKEIQNRKLIDKKYTLIELKELKKIYADLAEEIRKSKCL